jgi:ABC-type methionine transport system ATPase subunit
VEPYFALDDVWVFPGGNGDASPPILSRITLQIPPGGCWTVVGHSGAGKTTLLRLLNRMVEPTRGTVRREGVCLGDIPPSELRRQVGMVFQEPVWLPGTVRDNLLAAAALGVVPVERAEARLPEILSLIGLAPEFLTRDEDALSLGERQRVALGRALMTSPRALLLDEPTASLDPPGARSLIDQVLTLARAEQLTLVLVTHRLRDARQFGGDAVVLEGGRVVEVGPSEDVIPRLETRWEQDV